MCHLYDILIGRRTNIATNVTLHAPVTSQLGKHKLNFYLNCKLIAEQILYAHSITRALFEAFRISVKQASGF